MSPRARELHETWYGHDSETFKPEDYGSEPWTWEQSEILAFAKRQCERDAWFYGTSQQAVRREAERLAGLMNRGWVHHLNEQDIAALRAEDRLRGVPENISRRDFNAAYLLGLGHDAINSWVCIKARCEREGVSDSCEACEGHGYKIVDMDAHALSEAWEPTEPPAGDGYQIWETVSEGSPLSPVFATPEGLATWMAVNQEKDGSYEQWMKFITGPGWVPSAMSVGGDVRQGAAIVDLMQPAAEVQP